MTCSGAYATAEEYALFWCLDWPPDDCAVQERIELALRVTAGRIHVARSSVGACDCSLSTESLQMLKEMNMDLAAILYNCPCGAARGRLSDDMKQTMLLNITEMLNMISDGSWEVCDGETGANYPAIATAERGLTEWSEAQIIINRELRDG